MYHYYNPRTWLSWVSEGQGTGLVIATGAQNQLAKIASQVGSVGTPTTSLQRDLNRFVMIIASLAGMTTVIVIMVWALYLRVQHPGTYVRIYHAPDGLLLLVVLTLHNNTHCRLPNTLQSTL